MKPAEDGFVADDDGFVSDDGFAPDPVAPAEPGMFDKARELGSVALEQGAQGAGLGFIDELSGLGTMAAHGVKKAAHALAPETFNASPFEDASQAFAGGQQFTRAKDAQQHKDHRGLSLAANVAGSLPVALAAGAAIPAQMALGAASGFGNSNSSNLGDRIEDAAKMAALSGAVGVASKALGGATGTVGKYLQGKIDAAKQAAQGVKVDSALGALRSGAQAAYRDLEALMNIARNGTGPQAQAARERLAQPDAIQLLRELAESKSGSLGERIGELGKLREGFEAAKSGIGDGASSLMEGLKTTARNVAPVVGGYLGDKVGGWQGMLVGGVAGAAAGRPGAVAEAARKAFPAAAAVGLQGIKTLLADAPQFFGKFAGPLSQAAAKGDDALALTDYLLQTGDGGAEYRQKRQEMDNREQSPPSSRMAGY